MIQTALSSILTASILTLSVGASSLATSEAQIQAQSETVLGTRSMSLNTRWGYENPENVYKDNILLNLAYMNGTVKNKEDINWDNLKQPFSMEFSLEPGQRFAYHKLIDPAYQDNVAIAVDTNFGAGDGYKYSDGLYGMGVCHLASLIHWAALDAGLESVAPSNHDFYAIPEIPKEYGVAIFNNPNSPAASMKQNLYIKNNLDSKVTFKFDFDGTNLKVSVVK